MPHLFLRPCSRFDGENTNGTLYLNPKQYHPTIALSEADPGYYRGGGGGPNHPEYGCFIYFIITNFMFDVAMNLLHSSLTCLSTTSALSFTVP